MPMDETPPWSHPIEVQKLPSNGLELTLTPDSEVRHALADWIGASEISDMVADLTMRRAGKSDVKVSAGIRAHITQACVVSLEPVESRVDVTIKRRFSPRGEQPWFSEIEKPDAEPEILSVDDDPPTWYDGLTIDVGWFVSEELSLQVDPYPRKQGAVFQSAKSEETEEKEASPFAVLANLKKTEDE